MAHVEEDPQALCPADKFPSLGGQSPAVLDGAAGQGIILIPGEIDHPHAQGVQVFQPSGIAANSLGALQGEERGALPCLPRSCKGIAVADERGWAARLLEQFQKVPIDVGKNLPAGLTPPPQRQRADGKELSVRRIIRCQEIHRRGAGLQRLSPAPELQRRIAVGVKHGILH